MSWLYKDWPKTIVFIGKEDVNEKGERQQGWIGTGFLLNVNDVFCLCTAKHVIYDTRNKKYFENLFVSYNSKTNGIISLKLDELKEKYGIDWTFHANPEVDIAIIPFDVETTLGDFKTLPENMFAKFNEINETDQIFLIGFQPGIVLQAGFQRIEPIVRRGAVSLIYRNKVLLIDANVFPGNSGSPVFLGLIMHEFNQTTQGNVNINMGISPRSGKFIGIISSYIPYDEIAVSMQTNKPRVMFEENTGLAVVWSADFIQEMIISQQFKQSVSKALEKVEKPK